MSHLQSLKVGALEKEAMVRTGLFALWSLGRQSGGMGTHDSEKEFLTIGNTNRAVGYD